MSFNWDPMGRVVVELRADAAVAAIAAANPSAAAARVRPSNPAPKTDSYEGDAHGPGSYRAFIVIRELSTTRDHRVPIQRPRLALLCYGRDDIEAARLARAASDAFHGRGPRVAGNGLGIHVSYDAGSDGVERDPDTGQPYATVLIDLLATTQAVV